MIRHDGIVGSTPQTAASTTPHAGAAHAASATTHAGSATAVGVVTNAPRPVVLVTGAAQRLGRAIALDLAADGWNVALHHHTSSPDDTLADLRGTGMQAEAFAADLSDEAAVAALVPAVVATFGRLDAVVNNASLFAYDDVASFGHAAMQAHWRVNTAAPIALARALHAHVVARGEVAAGPGGTGCVVNLLDQKLWNPNPDHLSYTLSKAALHAATVALAQALAPALRVCGVAPGITLVSGPMDDNTFERAHRLTPLGRSSSPADIAQAVRYLLRAQAVTGTTLLVDGGQHLWGQPRDVMFLAQDPSGDAR